VTPDDILHTPFTSLAVWEQERQEAQPAQPEQGSQQQQQEKQPQEDAAAMDVEEAAPASGPAAAAASAAAGGGPGAGESSPALVAAQHQMLSTVLDECLLNPRVEVRCAGAVWLVSLLLYCGHHPRLLPLLPDVQQALGSLLGDQNELTQASEAVTWAQSTCLKHQLLLRRRRRRRLCLLVAVPCCCCLHSSLAAAVCSQLLMGLLSPKADLS
jgi:proteasome component ECM29